MNAKELAEKLDGIERRTYIPIDLEDAAKGADLVVVYGESDDLMEFRGAINDEIGAFDGGLALLTSRGLLHNECENDDCPYHAKEAERAETIRAIWHDGGDEEGRSWTFETQIPHETFEMMEDGKHFCRGIVFALADARVQGGCAMPITSTAKMIGLLEGFLGTYDFNDFESAFVENMARLRDSGQVTRLSETQVSTLKTLYKKHFGG